uniref:Uncharacterized protein n=1 Tax=Spongospora subterranea TaxID=70186 RepID=A0A0H5R9N7_9EUKA|eukprot:CRZ10397.1 hypothetical protein [Spongospora subterranea]
MMRLSLLYLYISLSYISASSLQLLSTPFTPALSSSSYRPHHSDPAINVPGQVGTCPPLRNSNKQGAKPLSLVASLNNKQGPTPFAPSATLNPITPSNPLTSPSSSQPGAYFNTEYSRNARDDISDFWSAKANSQPKFVSHSFIDERLSQLDSMFDTYLHAVIPRLELLITAALPQPGVKVSVVQQDVDRIKSVAEEMAQLKRDLFHCLQQEEEQSSTTELSTGDDRSDDVEISTEGIDESGLQYYLGLSRYPHIVNELNALLSDPDLKPFTNVYVVSPKYRLSLRRSHSRQAVPITARLFQLILGSLFKVSSQNCLQSIWSILHPRQSALDSNGDFINHSQIYKIQ